MKNRKLVVWITSILLLFIIAIIGFQISSKTTFGEIIDNSVDNKDKISHIIIKATKDIKGDSLWAKIDDPIIIEQLLNKQSDIKLRKNLTRNNSREPQHTMTVHTPSNSYYYDFNEDYFIGNGLEYKIVEGSISDTIRNLKNELEWKTIEEFMEVES